MGSILTAVFAALPTGVAETLQGGIVTLLTSGLRKALGEDVWSSWGPMAKMAMVGAVALLWAGATGLSGGLTGPALVTHIVGSMVAALGLRQAVKLPRKIADSKGKLKF